MECVPTENAVYAKIEISETDGRAASAVPLAISTD